MSGSDACRIRTAPPSRALPLLLLLTFSACAQQAPTSPDARRNAPLPSLIQLGDGLQRTGDTEGALALYRGAASQNGSDPVALERVGQALMAQGDPARAEQAFRAALALNGRLAGARSGRALAVLTQGHVTEALPMLAALANDQPTPQSLRAYGAALDMAGHQDEAQDAYHRGLALAPADANLHGNLALSLAAAGQMGAALDEMRLAQAAPLPDPRQDVNAVLLRAVTGQELEARRLGASLLGPARTEAVLRQARTVRAADDPSARATAFGLFIAKGAGPVGTVTIDLGLPGPVPAAKRRAATHPAAD